MPPQGSSGLWSAKRSELQLMVGGSYHQLIDSADAVVEMHATAARVEALLREMPAPPAMPPPAPRDEAGEVAGGDRVATKPNLADGAVGENVARLVVDNGDAVAAHVVRHDVVAASLEDMVAERRALWQERARSLPRDGHQ